MKATIVIGKPAEKGHSKIDVKLEEKDKGLCFSASGLFNYQYNRYMKDWDYEGGGQCIDTIAEKHPKNKDVQSILRLWKKHHLNDMNAGTKRQTDYLKSLGQYKSYDWACEELKKVDMYYDKEAEGYKYGSAWLYREIPTEDIQEIKELITKYQ